MCLFFQIFKILKEDEVEQQQQQQEDQKQENLGFQTNFFKCRFDAEITEGNLGYKDKTHQILL